MRQISRVIGGSYSSWDWMHFPELKKIIRYREKKPKGMEILREQINSHKAPTKKVDLVSNDRPVALN